MALTWHICPETSFSKMVSGSSSSKTLVRMLLRTFVGKRPNGQSDFFRFHIGKLNNIE